MAYTRPMILDPGDLSEGVYTDSGWRIEEGLPDAAEEIPGPTGGKVICTRGEATMWTETGGHIPFDLEFVGYTGEPITVYLSFDNIVDGCWGDGAYPGNQLPDTQAVLKYWTAQAHVTVTVQTSVGLVNITDASYEYAYS